VCAPSHRVAGFTQQVACDETRPRSKAAGRTRSVVGPGGVGRLLLDGDVERRGLPRALHFLFSRNRLNVAVSRAMCLAVVVASSLLLESRARTIEQMRLINALCRFVDLATPAV